MGHEPLGLSVEQDGTRIAPAAFTAPPGVREPLRFRVLDDDGAPLRSGFEVEARAAPAPDPRPPRPDRLPAPASGDGARRHLERAAARSPSRAPTASSPTSSATARSTSSRPICSRPGDFEPRAAAGAGASASADGYDVRLERPVLRAGREAAAAVLRQPRWAARRGDPALSRRARAPRRAAPGRPRVPARPSGGGRRRRRCDPRSRAEFLSAGAYRLFLQFRAGGAVHTAAFTVEVAP